MSFEESHGYRGRTRRSNASTNARLAGLAGPRMPGVGETVIPVEPPKSFLLSGNCRNNPTISGGTSDRTVLAKQIATACSGGNAASSCRSRLVARAVRPPLSRNLLELLNLAARIHMRLPKESGRDVGPTRCAIWTGRPARNPRWTGRNPSAKCFRWRSANHTTAHMEQVGAPTTSRPLKYEDAAGPLSTPRADVHFSWDREFAPQPHSTRSTGQVRGAG